MEWLNTSDITWLGEQDAAAVLSNAHLAIMLGDWDGKGYARFRLSDGRAAWLRFSLRYSSPKPYVAYLAPWGSLFDFDHVPDDAMLCTVKPEGWRTKSLDGIRAYSAAADPNRAENRAAQAEKAAQKAQAAELRAAKAAERARLAEEKRKRSVGRFETGAFAAIELTTGEAIMCFVVALSIDGLPDVVRQSDTSHDLTRNSLSAMYPQGYRWRSLSKWPKGAERVWRSGRSKVKTYWGLTCKLGGAEGRK